MPNLRLIAPDTPGFGQTDFVEGITTITNWPNDIAALADSLGFEKFAVFAPSGGGPFALSCAWKVPERLTLVGIFAGVGPFIPETDKNIAAPMRMMWTKAPKSLGLFKLQMKLVAELIRPDRNESYRQGGIGSWYDAMISGNWPIPLNEIRTKVYLWQGEEDISVPLSMWRYMAEKVPNCEAEFIEGVGHFGIFEHLAAMLEKLVSDNDGKR